MSPVARGEKGPRPRYAVVRGTGGPLEGSWFDREVIAGSCWGIDPAVPDSGEVLVLEATGDLEAREDGAQAVVVRPARSTVRATNWTGLWKRGMLSEGPKGGQ